MVRKFSVRYGSDEPWVRDRDAYQSVWLLERCKTSVWRFVTLMVIETMTSRSLINLPRCSMVRTPNLKKLGNRNTPWNHTLILEFKSYKELEEKLHRVLGIEERVWERPPIRGFGSIHLLRYILLCRSSRLRVSRTRPSSWDLDSTRRESVGSRLLQEVKFRTNPRETSLRTLPYLW